MVLPGIGGSTAGDEEPDDQQQSRSEEPVRELVNKVRRLRRSPAPSPAPAQRSQPSPSPNNNGGGEASGGGGSSPNRSQPATNEENIRAGIEDVKQAQRRATDSAPEDQSAGGEQANQQRDGGQQTSGTGGGQQAASQDGGDGGATTQSTPEDELQSVTQKAKTRQRESADGSAAPEPEPKPTPEPDQPATPEQGLEAGGGSERRVTVTLDGEEFTGDFTEVSQQIEQDVLADNPALNPEDVRVGFAGSDRGFTVELTEGAEERVANRQETQFDRLDATVGSAVVAAEEAADDGQPSAPERVIQQREVSVGGAIQEAQDTAAGSDAASRVEQQLEEQVGRQRAEALGVFNPQLREGVIESTDLERGEDFILREGEAQEQTITDPETGETVTQTVTPVEAELTEGFEQGFREEAAGSMLAQQFGTTFVPGEDFTLDDEEGVELTGRGRAKAQTQNLRREVAELEAGNLPFITELTGIRGPEFDVPGEGPLLPESDPNRDLGQVDVPVRMSPEDEFTTFEDALAAAEEKVIEATGGTTVEPATFPEAAPGRAGAGTRLEARNFEEGDPPGRKPVVQASQTLSRFLPLAATRAVGGAKNLAEFQTALFGSAVRGDFERTNELTENLKAAAVETAVLQGETAAEDPGEFVARGVGSLIASVPVFGAARAVGPRTSLATRAAIQPGEELVGIGGNRITRLVASERAAERLFPNSEPLIFSEEAAIRAAGATGRRASSAARGVRERLGEEAISARFRAAELGTGDVPTRPLGVGERLARARKSLEFRAAEVDPRSDVKRPEGVTRRTAGRLAEQTQDILDRIEVENDRVGAGAGAIPDVRLRPRAESEVETEQEVVERVGEGQVTKPSVEADTESEAVERVRRAESAVVGEDLLSEPDARRIAAEVSQARQRDRAELPGAELGRPAIDVEGRQDFRSDLERRSDLFTEAEIEPETETEVRAEPFVESRPFEVELEQELEAERERETEIEIVTELKNELEAEREGRAELRGREDEEGLFDLLTGGQTFESGIAASGGEALADVEQDLIEGFEAAESEAALADDFQAAERDLLEGLDF